MGVQPPTKNIRKQISRNTQSLQVLSDRDNPVFRRISSNPIGGTGSSGTKRAVCTADAGLGNTITATLFKFDGTTGEGVTIYCNLPSIITDLNEASPLLEIGSILYAKRINIDNAGTPEPQWECIQLFDVTEECECTTP
jgi:hypothetical protein